MKIIYLIIAIIIAFLAPAHGATNLPASVALLVHFDRTPAESVTASLEAESSRLFEEAGLHLAWFEKNAANSLGSPAAVIVVEFNGACRPNPLPPRSLVTGSLAHVPSVEGHIEQWITVDCERLASYLPRALGGEDANSVYGRALARVLAHELFHCITDEDTHSHSLLFRSGVSAQDLVTPAAAFTDAEQQRLRQALQRL